MTLAALLIFAAVALTPLAWTLRWRGAVRGRRDSALALHRAQLAELDRDLADGRIAEAEHATARLEVQRRLLAAAETAEVAPMRASVAPLAFAMLLIPLGAAFLYLLNGHPDMPAAPRAKLLAEAAERNRNEAGLVDQLKARIAQLDPRSPQAREGYVLLGNVAFSRGDLPEAAKAWRTAVGISFDAALAAQAAEAATRAEGKVSDSSADLFRRALEAAPPDAAWRGMVQSRLAEAGKS